MSTSFDLLNSELHDVYLTERSAKFDLDIETLDATLNGPRGMNAEQVLVMAAGMFYAVWRSYPVEAEIMVEQMRLSIPNVWNQIQRAKNETAPANRKVS